MAAINNTTDTAEMNFFFLNSSGNGSDKPCIPQWPLLSSLEQNFFAYCYPPLLIICVLANSISVWVYQQRFFKTSPTIRLLAAKAVANVLSITSLMPTLLSVYPYFTNDHNATRIYWHSTIYMGFFTNLFGHTAVIITVLVTVERYVLVAFPVSGRRFSTMRNANLGVLMAFIVAFLVHMEYPLNRYIAVKTCRLTGNITFRVQYYSKKYLWAYMNISAVLVLGATLILFVFAVLIYYELFGRSRSVQSAQEQRQSATRLTIATASTFLFLTAPQSPIFLYHFANITASPLMSTVTAVINFLSLIETTAPFFVYYACSKRFRQLCTLLLCPNCVTLKEEDLQVLQGNSSRTRTSSVITTADFRCDSTKRRADSQPLLPINQNAKMTPTYNGNSGSNNNIQQKLMDQAI